MRQMHLAIDGVGHKIAGVAAVFVETLNAAIENESIAQITVFCSPRSVRSYELPSSPKLVAIEEPRAESVFIRHWWYAFGLPGRVKEIRPDALLCLHSAGLSP